MCAIVAPPLFNPNKHVMIKSSMTARRSEWIRQDWRIILFGFLLMFCSSPGQTYFIALFGGEIREAMSLSHGQFGALYSSATLCSAFVLLWTGSLVDRVRLHWVTVIVSLGLVVSSWLMAASTGLVALFVALFMLRQFGQGLTGMTSVTTMMRYVPAHRAKAGALSHMGYSTAEAILPSIVVAALVWLSWREVWQWVGLIVLLVLPTIAVSLLASHRAKHARSAKTQTVDQTAHIADYQWTRGQVVKDPLFYLILPGLTCQSLLYTGYMFHQVHLVEQKGWALAMWASLYLVFSLTTIIMSFVLGSIVDRLGPLRVIPWVNVPMILGLVVLASTDSIVGAAVFMICMAVSTAGQAANSGPFYSTRYGNKHLGSIKSLGTFCMVLMTALSPIVLGLFIDAQVSMNVLAIGGAGYAILVSVMAMFGCRQAHLKPLPTESHFKS